MLFSTFIDKSNVKHNYLVIPLSDKEFSELVGLCEKCIPSISVSALIHRGHPYVVANFDGGAWKTAWSLDETARDREKLGDKLSVGDVITVILTAKPQDKVIKVLKEKVDFIAPLEEVLAFSFTYNKEIKELFDLHSIYSSQ